MLACSQGGEITGWESLAWHWAVPPLGRGDMDKVRLVPLLSSNGSKFIWVCLFGWFWREFWLQLCVGTSLVETKTSTKVLICMWMSKTVFSKGSYMVTERGWSWFLNHCSVHSQDCGQCTIIQCISKWDSSQFPWCMVLDPTVPTKTSVCPWISAELLMLERVDTL